MVLRFGRGRTRGKIIQSATQNYTDTTFWSFSFLVFWGPSHFPGFDTSTISVKMLGNINFLALNSHTNSFWFLVSSISAVVAVTLFHFLKFAGGLQTAQIAEAAAREYDIPILTGSKETAYHDLIREQYVKDKQQIYLLKTPFRTVFVLPPKFVTQYGWKAENLVCEFSFF